ncbi:MAG TPA: TolC family protein, partial [Pirellulales bacterium]
MRIAVEPIRQGGYNPARMSQPILSLHRLGEQRGAPPLARPLCFGRWRRGRGVAPAPIALAATVACLLIGCSSLKLELPRLLNPKPNPSPNELNLAGASAAAAAKSVAGAVKAFPSSEKNATKVAAESSQPAAEELPPPPPLGLAPTDPADFQPLGGLKTYPIDLASALRLAGASHLQIALAKERTRETEAKLAQARARWLPTLQAGVGYTLHDGLTQMADGTVVEQRSSAMFTGGGASLGLQPPLAGASTGPARLTAQVSLADAIFDPLAARQTVRAAVAREDAVFHRGVLEAAVAFIELQRAHARAGVLAASALEGDRLAEFATALSRKVNDPRVAADVAYVGAAAFRRRQEWLAEQERTAIASAALARVLQLDASVLLAPAEKTLAPLELFDGEKTLAALVADAWATRPEVAEQKAALKRADVATQEEYWRPWLPNVYVGYGSGQFSGSSTVQTADGARSDFDAIALWRLENLGAGPRTSQRTEVSRQRQAVLQEKDVRDAVANETAVAYHKAMHGRRGVEAAGGMIEAAEAVWKAERAALEAGRPQLRQATDALDQWRLAQLDYIDRVAAL